jgi:hypothetical protein
MNVTADLPILLYRQLHNHNYSRKIKTLRGEPSLINAFTFTTSAKKGKKP